MKNIYHILVFTVLFSNVGFAQDLQNSHWYFGQGVGLHFDTPTPTTSELPDPIAVTNEWFHNLHAHTTVSDDDGNLLYFSDGRSIFQPWNGGYAVLANLLPISDVYGENRTVSIPKPNNPGHYYVVSLNNYDSSGSNSGLKYMELDFSNGLGQVVSQDNYLKDDNNTVIGSGYALLSSAISSTVHADGENYWLIVHVKNQNYSKILSYKVTATDIEETPSEETVFPNIKSVELKISPNTKNLAIGTESGVYIGTFDYEEGTIAMITSPIGATSNLYCNALEFSPDSNNLYYSIYGDLYGIQVMDIRDPLNEILIHKEDFIGMQLAIDGKIYLTHNNNSFSLSVISNPDTIFSPGLSVASISFLNFVETGLPQWVHSNFCTESEVTGIFRNSLGQFEWDDTSYSYTIEIVGDNDCNWPEGTPVGDQLPSLYGTVTVTDNFIYPDTLPASIAGKKELRWRIKTQCGNWSDWCCYDGNSAPLSYPYPFSNGTCFYGDQPCNADFNLYITQEVFSNENVEEQATNMIVASNTINDGATANYHTENTIVLVSDFFAQSGVDFIGHIEECSEVQNRTSGLIHAKKFVQAQKPGSLIGDPTSKGVTISPNPSRLFTQIEIEHSQLRSITLYSVEGKIMFNKQTAHTNSYQLDTSSLLNGMYFISVETVDGKIHSEKLLKN